jgi:hypothetical protein
VVDAKADSTNGRIPGPDVLLISGAHYSKEVVLRGLGYDEIKHYVMHPTGYGFVVLVELSYLDNAPVDEFNKIAFRNLLRNMSIRITNKTFGNPSPHQIILTDYPIFWKYTKVEHACS